MKKILSYVLLMMSAFVLLTSCGKDDDNFDDVNVSDYIIGTWHSYRIVGHWNNQTIEREVTKTNEFSVSYGEITFRKDGRCISSAYVQGENGLSTWQIDDDPYVVNGNTITIYGKDETAQFFYDKGELFMRGTEYYQGYVMTIFLYFCK